MTALAVGGALVGLTAICVAALLRVRGVVAFLLAVGLVAAGELVALSHLLSRFRAYERGWMLLALVLLAAVAVVATAVGRPAFPMFPLAKARLLAGDRLLLVLAVIVLAELLYLGALSLLTPPVERDALGYHLMRALLWIQREEIGTVSDAADVRINDFPVNAEILQGATMLLSGSMRWVGVVQMAALGGAMVAVFGIARRIGLNERQAMFGAVLFATLPVVALQAPSALNDVIVASLVATAGFFVLGRTRAELGLAGLAVALLIGTKVTAVLALPVLLGLAVTAKRGRQLAALLVAGASGVLVGGAWYVHTLVETGGLLGTIGESHGGGTDVYAAAARATRYVVEAVELPGAPGRDRFLYVIGACAIGIAGLVLRRPGVYGVAAVLALFPLAVLPLERVLHKTYWRWWDVVGYEQALPLGVSKNPTTASNVLSWYGPVGLAAAVVALVVVARAVRRHVMPLSSLVLASAPIAFIALIAITVTYIDLNGRFAMGGVALSAATWGVIRPLRAPAIALVCVTATTVLLALVNYNEKPSGVDLLEGLNRPSIWTLPRGWAQSIEPEIARLIVYSDDNVPETAPIAVARSVPYAVAYAGYPAISRRIAYADTQEEADERNADWAVLPVSVGCADGWRLVFRSPPWGIFQRVDQARCAGPLSTD